MENELELYKGRLYNQTNGKNNKTTRVSTTFWNKLNYINEKRNEEGLVELSNPKITELIIRHKLWNVIQQDLINYLLEAENES